MFVKKPIFYIEEPLNLFCLGLKLLIALMCILLLSHLEVNQFGAEKCALRYQHLCSLGRLQVTEQIRLIEN